MDGGAAYCLRANRSFTSSRSSLDKFWLPDESIDGLHKRSFLDSFDFLKEPNVVGEGNRELELNSSMTIVDASVSSPIGLAEVEGRLWKADRDPESAARVVSSKERDELLTVEDEENQFSGSA